MSKVYTGTRTPEGCVVTVDDKPLDLRLDLANHSPTGFEWGYSGSGPAQLALAILADCFGNDDEHAVKLHQNFKWRWAAALEGDWQITSDEVLRIVSAL